MTGLSCQKIIKTKSNKPPSIYYLIYYWRHFYVFPRCQTSLFIFSIHLHTKSFRLVNTDQSMSSFDICKLNHNVRFLGNWHHQSQNFDTFEVEKKLSFTPKWYCWIYSLNDQVSKFETCWVPLLIIFPILKILHNFSSKITKIFWKVLTGTDCSDYLLSGPFSFQTII